ncbi:NAD(P)-dependent oxidoreductase [Mesobacillus foraminis]|uniref:precorrin-2 dehydrogenase n=1 Tax=Mesobacillus foraminis TaxID=279826 RepID=A0A4R2AXY6_9BACI|nr:NAD(P)-dependent oxidoreductase [Mesobacillus foraminis]TCN18841.1 precorrin-2 dehydrogenase/sirohydrochlorin ferrochelatase [Mesobacillus foraminis]
MTYPVFLELKGRQAAVVGGGKVAQRKVEGLLEAGAQVIVISPDLTERLQDFAAENKVGWKNKFFSPDDIKDAFIIIAATDDKEVNLLVKRSAGKHQIVNLADNQEESDFQVPSVVNRGKLKLAVSTSGASPILARKIREQLEKLYGGEYEGYLEFLHESRKKILDQVKDPAVKRQLLTAITDKEFYGDCDREARLQELLRTVREQE